MKSKALIAKTALMLALSAVSCGSDNKKNPPETAYGEVVRTTASGMETETTSAENIEMPDITGMKEDIATDLLRLLGIEYETVYSTDTDMQKGFVIKTEPKADKEIKKDEKATIYISE